MGKSSHMKRLAMPRSWPLPRKTSVWVQRPDPCGHSIECCMPVGIILRDILGFAGTRKEANQIIQKGIVKVDGKEVKSINRGVGLFDILTIGDQSFICIFDKRGRLSYNLIDSKKADTKLCRLNGKTTIKGGMTQLNFHDGRTMLVENASKDDWATGSTCKINLSDGSVVETYTASSGAQCYLTGGNHVGEIATIKEVEIKRSSMPNEVNFEEGFGTIQEYVMVIPSSDDIPMGVDE